jgi:hypothetical protein
MHLAPSGLVLALASQDVVPVAANNVLRVVHKLAERRGVEPRSPCGTSRFQRGGLAGAQPLLIYHSALTASHFSDPVDGVHFVAALISPTIQMGPGFFWARSRYEHRIRNATVFGAA